MSELITGNIRFNRNQKYIVLDYETCSLNILGLENKGWQVGLVLAQGNEIKESYDLLVNWPNLNVSTDAARITRFDAEKVKREGKKPEEVLKFIDSYLYNPEYKVVGHNYLNFDSYIHNIFRRNLGYKSDYSYINRVIDTRALITADKLGIQLADVDDFTMFQYKMLGYHKRGFKTNLTASCKEYEVEVDESKTHSAYDTELTFFILQKLLKKFNIT